MPGSQLGYLDSKERSLIIVVSGCRIMKNIQNYTHDIFFSQTYSVSSVICVNIHSVASANFDFTFDFSLFLHLCPNKSLSFIYTPSKLKKKKKENLVLSALPLPPLRPPSSLTGLEITNREVARDITVIIQ